MCELTNNHRIEQLNIAHIEQVMDIENEAFISPWPRQVIEEESKKNRSFCRISLDENKVVTGFCISVLIYDEIHILKIAVHKDYRRKGVGKHLLNDSFDFYKYRGAKKAILEVRTSNYGAIKLYKKLGFGILRVRKNYYRSSGDAYVMMLNLQEYGNY